ncbi:hypothetical protein OROGR_023923 [Orobanche gracilis]
MGFIRSIITAAEFKLLNQNLRASTSYAHNAMDPVDKEVVDERNQRD